MEHQPSSVIPFIDLAAQQSRLGTRIQDAMARVLAHGQYILGPEIAEFETQLAAFCGVKHALSCASGTDALALVLAAKAVRPGDAVMCPAFTFCATAEVVAWLGATPIFVDSDPQTFNMDTNSLKAAVATARKQGMRPVGIIPVDLFGLTADYDAIAPIAAENNMFVLSDAAQSFGASWNGKRAGSFGLATATSFFPAKPLGCYGDGGAVMTDDCDLFAVMKSLRVHGQGSNKYDNVRIGMAARMDTLQAAILLEKLAIFGEEVEARQRVATRYSEALKDFAQVPYVPQGAQSVWAQYTLKVDAEKRTQVMERLKSKGIPTMVYYPIPLNKQTAYKHYPTAGNGIPVAERLAREVMSLPMHPYLTDDVQDYIIAEVRAALAA